VHALEKRIGSILVAIIISRDTKEIADPLNLTELTGPYQTL